MFAKVFRPPVIAAQTGLDRASEKRGDREWLAAKLGDARSRFLILVDLKLAVSSSPDRAQTAIRWLDAQAAAQLGARFEEAVLLGALNGAAHFALALSAAEFARLPLASALDPLVDVRSLAVQGAMPPQELQLAAQARALAAWHGISRCCGRCGGATAPRDAGWRRRCGACGLDVYPRSDPAVIMLVTDGERCLIGHERRFPDKFYSVLAGFVEPGDDIEHAVRREIMEEAGVRVGAVHYLGSQPWPFPHALMIGCWAEALSTELTIDPAELTDARWADRAEIAAMLVGRHPEGLFLPPPISMAHSLIRAFVDAGPR